MNEILSYRYGPINGQHFQEIAQNGNLSRYKVHHTQSKNGNETANFVRIDFYDGVMTFFREIYHPEERSHRLNDIQSYLLAMDVNLDFPVITNQLLTIFEDKPNNHFISKLLLTVSKIFRNDKSSTENNNIV